MNYDGNIEAEAAIVKIALCDKYQKMYSTLQEAGQKAGLYPYEIEDIRKWKYHAIGNPIDAIDMLYYYFRDHEGERYRKSAYIYNNKR